MNNSKVYKALRKTILIYIAKIFLFIYFLFIWGLYAALSNISLLRGQQATWWEETGQWAGKTDDYLYGLLRELPHATHNMIQVSLSKEHL